ncbi:hypothetical protein GRS48_11905 [Halorubrum sp. JWXQ-INN 858]|uniref:hypothetical protein n=1 Tax=Halorubrum sp. JWXQ-INN 858 TaxID=2690782 RepID=UPI00135902CA|nr:hypothetical protein [Halorubrum sp. JWXQ-INN 858]MWV65516.1 hypothetical protein [Halorubrum sp. JWXQ-INN 858]
MSTPSLRTLLVATIGGFAHLGVVEFLFRLLGHVPDSLWPLASVENAAFVFAFGFLVVLLTVHTRLLSPVVGLPALLAWATYRDVASPTPVWSELGGHLVVDGPVSLARYVWTWEVWLATFVVLAAVEYGLRHHYGVGDERLRNLPPLPSSRREVALVAGAAGGTFGVAVVAWMAGIGVNPAGILPLLAVTTGLAAAVPVGAAVARGLVAPTACFLALVVPVLLGQTFAGSEGGPVFLLFLGPIAVGFAIVGLLENVIRSRLSGRFGGFSEGPG